MCKRVNKTNIRKALRASYDRQTYEDVNDEWQACIYHGRETYAVLWNWKREVSLKTGSIMGCESMTELIRYATELLLKRYEKLDKSRTRQVDSIAEITCWEQAEPFVDELDRAERAVYANACDYHYYGMSLQSMIDNGHHCDLPEQRVRELWKLAFWYMAEGCMAA